jgi:hypothetical protein
MKQAKAWAGFTLTIEARNALTFMVPLRLGGAKTLSMKLLVPQ